MGLLVCLFFKMVSTVDHWKLAAFDPGEVDRGAAGLKDPALNFGRLKTRIDLGLDAHQLPGLLQIVQTGS